MRISIGLIICLLVSSSFPTHQLALTDLSKEVIQWPFKISGLKITYTRDTLLPMNCDVPMIPAKKRYWKGNPPLSELNRTDIERIIRNTEKTDGILVNIEFKILEGFCELHSDWKSGKEYAKFKGELFLEIPSRNYTYKSYAEMYFDYPIMNGTEKGTMHLYNQAVKNVTHMVLRQIRDEINSRK